MIIVSALYQPKDPATLLFTPFPHPCPGGGRGRWQEPVLSPDTSLICGDKKHKYSFATVNSCHLKGLITSTDRSSSTHIHQRPHPPNRLQTKLQTTVGIDTSSLSFFTAGTMALQVGGLNSLDFVGIPLFVWCAGAYQSKMWCKRNFSETVMTGHQRIVGMRTSSFSLFTARTMPLLVAPGSSSPASLASPATEVVTGVP